MEKAITLTVTVEESSERKILKINLEHHQLAEWALLLTMLQYQLIDIISVLHNERTYLLVKKLEKKKQKVANTRGQVTEHDGVTTLTISDNELDFWLAYFLTAHRDGGIQQRTHIDLDISPHNIRASYSHFYLILSAPSI